LVEFIQIVDAFDISGSAGTPVFHLNLARASSPLKHVEHGVAFLKLYGHGVENGSRIGIPGHRQRDGIRLRLLGRGGIGRLGWSGADGRRLA